MAPTDAAKALQSNGPRPFATKPIVPAIPLTYIQRRKHYQHVVPNKLEVISPRTPPVDVSPNASLPAADTSTGATHGASDASENPETETELSVAIAAAPLVMDESGTPVDEVHEASDNLSMTEGLQQNQPLVPTDQISSETKSTYSMPPAFVPADRGHSNSDSTEAVTLPKQQPLTGNHPMHNAHPSASSLVFGGYPESNNSSPAPPLSAGGNQTQSYPIHNDVGRAQPPPHVNGGHLHSFSNGYSPLGPPPPGYYPRQDGYVNHSIALDSFARRQMISFAPTEGYSPSGTPTGVENHRFSQYDPSTPHSFHGSQSSVPNEQDASGPQYHPQYSTAVISNGSNGHIDDVRLYQQPHQNGRTSSQLQALGHSGHSQPGMVQPQMLPTMDNLDGLVEYLQSQFAEPQFADYTLELRYSDDRATPVRIPGHNLLFARSPTLKNLMVAQTESNGDALAPRTLFIESEDRFLRSDGFWMAVQRLYGGPLLDPGVSATAIIPAASQLSTAIPGTPADRFDVALGYAAAGHILQMPPVVNRGIDIASHFVNWLTLEKALDFALDGGLDSHWTLTNSRFADSRSTYGPAVNMLIHSTLNFIITTFPPNFELDISVADPVHYRRLPLVIESRPALPNPRLSSIKFGDHLSEDTTWKASNNSTTAALSRVLLNVPFPLLKYVLESSRLGNVHGWATSSLRQKVMHSVINEREKRRNEVRDKNVPDAERKANLRYWEVAGWQESLVPPYGGAETPSLIRTWVDFIPQESR